MCAHRETVEVHERQLRRLTDREELEGLGCGGVDRARVVQDREAGSSAGAATARRPPLR